MADKALWKNELYFTPEIPTKDNGMIEKAGFLQLCGWFGTF